MENKLQRTTLILVVVFFSFSINNFASAQKFCSIGGPTDASTLKYGNYIENYGSLGRCLKQEKYGFSVLQPINLEACTWNNRLPAKQQLFNIRNHNGGSTVQSVLAQFGNRCMVAPTGSLASNTCIPKSDEQTWVFNLVNARQQLYTILKKSNRKCLKVVGRSSVVETQCNSRDSFQLWRICASK